MTKPKTLDQLRAEKEGAVKIYVQIYLQAPAE